MRKLSLTVMSAIMALGSISAEDISVGYCDGNNVDGSVTGVNGAAITLPSEQFPMYAASSIIGVRIGVASSIDRGVEIFLRNGIDGEKYLDFKSGTLYPGWNDIYFDSQVAFPGTDLTVGFRSLTNTTIEPGYSGISDDTSYGAYMVFANGKWVDYCSQGIAPLCIQLLIDGDSYTKTDVGLISIDHAIVARNRPFAVTGRVRNNTNTILSKVGMRMEIGGKEIESVAETGNILPGETGTFRMYSEGLDMIGEFPATLNITDVAGIQDEFAFNDKAPMTVNVIDEIVDRKVLVEEFTGQNCPNCPYGKDKIDDAVKGLDNIVLVAHHTGFGNDAYTATGSTMLHYFYNSNGSTYAPAIMIDRLTMEGEKSPVRQVEESQVILSRLRKRIDTPAEVSLSLKRNYNPENRHLIIEVGMKQVEGLTVGDNPVLSLLLVENGIIGYQSPNYNEYSHDHANRKFVTAPLGDEITLGASCNTVLVYEVDVDPLWNTDNMEIVAFISNHDTSDCNNCMVYNAESCALVGSDIIEGYGEVRITEEEVSVEAIYSITGMRRDTFVKGINIVKYTDGSIRKVIR